METNGDGAQARVARVKALIGDGEQNAARGDVFKARDTFKQALAIEPRDPAALFALGSLYERMGNNPPGIMARQDLWMDAIKTYEKLMEIDPAHVEARVHAGYTHLRFGEFEGTGDKAREQFKKAGESLEEAIKIDPGHAGAWYALAFVYLQEKQQPEAINAFFKAVELSPVNIDAWWNLGALLEHQGNYQEALEAFQRVSTLDPKRKDIDWRLQRLRIRLEPKQGFKENAPVDDTVLAWLDTGTKLLSESNFPKAIQFLSKALKHFESIRNVTGQLEAARNIAAAHKALRQWEPAMEALIKARDLAAKKGDHQKRAEASHNLGYICFLAKDFGGAITNFTESIALYREIDDKPKVADGLANLGKSFRGAGDHARALKSLEEALEADVEANNASNQAKDQCEIAETYKLLADPTRAIEHYKEAIAIYQQLKYGRMVTEIQGMIKDVRAVNKKKKDGP